MGGIGLGLMLRGCLEPKQRTLSEKITKAKRAGGMVQVVERLSNKHEALNSSPSPTKNG
jgi:hypothetical protein